ncbi:MAG: hypothetical protein P8103_05310 [Candidatus Thiodiazotropha sp.]
MLSILKKTGPALCLVSCCWLTTTLPAMEGQNPDWPCPQILVPELQAAIVWAGPSIEGMEAAWQQDPEIEALVRKLTAPAYDMDAADTEIAAFAESQKPAEKDHKLTLLFAGVLNSLNEERGEQLNGIMRYARGQSARAERLSEELDEMVRLQDDPSSEAQERFALMQKEMDLKQRIFDEREMFIQHLCTRPVVVEQKLGVLARTIAYYLD